MKVKRVMTKSVGVCREKDNLSKAVEVMWQKDCGVVPVVNKKSKVVGTITDRDVTVSGFLQNKVLDEIKVKDIIGGKVKTCTSEDKIEKVLKMMKKHQIKRIPIVKKNGKIEGIISVTDILLASNKNKSLRKKVMKTLEAIGKPRPIILKQVEK